ncbi:MAG TPA: F0F1 ATP synthase subunit gamma [Candidatus Dormibacteraeota bacterium]|nr:F0F1 ATP synthase subunit gamma [Candidatus Dormibacteraeota bacterium]
MRKANAIQREAEQITTVGDLTGVFESIASTQVAKIKNKVELSKEFFELLWKRYSSIRVDPNSRITNRKQDKDGDRKVFVIISAEAGLSGDIDQRLIETMLPAYDPATTDIIVLGSHGANQLKQRGIPYVRYFQVPQSDSYIDVSPVIEAIAPYSDVKVYYEEYISLGVQGIKTIDLMSTMRAMSAGAETDEDEDTISDQDTIFEPSLDEIAEQMEMTMITLAFSQAILESSLAQDASRFNAMAVAKKRAWELLVYYQLEFHRSKRSESDRRLREVMVSLKKKKKKKDSARHR